MKLEQNNVPVQKSKWGKERKNCSRTKIDIKKGGKNHSRTKFDIGKGGENIPGSKNDIWKEGKKLFRLNKTANLHVLKRKAKLKSIKNRVIYITKNKKLWQI